MNKEFYEYNRKKYKTICDLLTRTWVTVTLLLFVFDRNFGFGALVFGVWSYLWYYFGKMSKVNEDWKDGYPREGFRWIIKSWIFLLIVVGIIGCFCFVL